MANKRTKSGKGRAGKKTTRGRGKRGTSRKDPLLTRDQQREILSYTLLVLAVLVLLALVPIGWLGAWGEGAFPSGNMIGAVGAAVRGWLLGAFGVASVFVPILVGLGGLHTHRWVTTGTALRFGALFAGLLLLVPTGLGIIARAGLPAGWLGAVVAAPLTAGLGWLGASVLTVAALLGLSITTLRWNPVPPIGRAVVMGGGAIGRAVKQTRESLRIAPERRRAAEDVTTETNVPFEPVLAPEPDPTAPAESVAGPDGGATAPEPKEHAPEETSPSDLPEPASAADGGLPHALPPLDLLTAPNLSDRRGMDAELDHLGTVLVEKLRTFNVECTLAGRTTGPVVTQFEIVPAPGVKVNRIANLDADLALAMKAKSIRIVAPIPGKGAVGVEIPNPKANVVQLSEILDAPQFRVSKATLPLGLGRDLTGRPYVADLAKMPHVLIAGATGSGKSVCLNTIITSLVYKHTPETLRLLLIDPKMVELSAYVDLPHLRHSVVTDPKDAAGVLKWAVLEMERRYALLSANGVRSLAEFNRKVKAGAPLRRPEADGAEGDPDRFLYTDGILPYVVVVVDELADLMMTVQGEVEKPLTQLAQKARAIGIHLIVATQRPSVNVITGLIKANFPTRIAFRVASKTDSRTILDQNGADALLGNGDMLFLPPGQSEPVRMQGAFISTEDTDHLTGWYRDRREQAARDAEAAEADGAEDDILEVVKAHEAEAGGELDVPAGQIDRDDLFRRAAEVCIQHQQGSTSLLQRKLRVGYGRAARIVDQLHDSGILGPPEGSKPREVLIGLDGLELLMSGGPPGTGIETSG